MMIVKKPRIFKRNRIKTFLESLLSSSLERFSKRTGTSFQNGKARGQSGHNSISTSGVSVAFLPYKFRTSLRWFSRHDQNARDLRKFCAYKRDNAVWNFRTYFHDNLVPSFSLFGLFIYSEFPKGNTIVGKRRIQDFRAQYTCN